MAFLTYLLVWKVAINTIQFPKSTISTRVDSNIRGTNWCVLDPGYPRDQQTNWLLVEVHMSHHIFS